jgi:drug/metabolite transporter (DMT)-like permease
MNSPPAVPTTREMSYYVAVAAALLTVVVWASAFPLIRIALGGFAPLPLAASRFWLAGTVAAGWVLIARPALPSRRDAGTFLASGLIGIALYNAFLNTGQLTVSPGAASFLINSGPIITAALATIFLRERFGPGAWIGSAIAFSGVAIIATGQPGGLRLGAGASLILLAALCQATYFIIQRPLVPRYGAFASTAYTIIAGALLLTPWLPAGITSLNAAGPSSAAAHALTALVIFPSILGYAAWTYALGRLGAARAANFLYLVPPLATGVAYVLTREAPSWATILGGGLAIGGVAVVNLRSKFAQARAADPFAQASAAHRRALDRAAGTWGGYQAARPVRLGADNRPQPSPAAEDKRAPLNCRTELARL